MKAKSVIKKIGFLTMLAFSLQACSIASIHSAKPISTPKNLTKEEVKFAIYTAVYPEKTPTEWKPSDKMSDVILSSNSDKAGSKRVKQHWFVEEIRPDSVVIGFRNYAYYFRTEYIIEDDQIIQRIDGSTGLKQTKNSIHKTVFKWLGGLEAKTRASMGRISAMKYAAQN